MNDSSLTPKRMIALPVDADGQPIPYIIAIDDGRPNYRLIDRTRLSACAKSMKCVFCGEKVGRYKAFLLAPIATLDRNTMVPPSHRDCTEYMAQHRADLVSNILAGWPEPADSERVACVWVVDEVTTPLVAGEGDAMQWVWPLGAPADVSWWKRGEAATRDDVLNDMSRELPSRIEAVQRAAVETLNAQLQRAMFHIPLVAAPVGA